MDKEFWEIWLEDEKAREMTKEEIETIGSSSIEKEEVLYYVEARTKRSKASYSTKKVFDKNEAETLRLKAISFVNKVKNIIDAAQ